MPDDVSETGGPTAGEAPGVPDTVRVDASLPNPTGAPPDDGTLPGAVGRTEASGRRGGKDARADPGSEPTSAGSDRSPVLCADGGANPNRNSDYDRVHDGGIVVRLESDGVLLHAGAGRTDGQWIATDRETLVAREEMQ